MTKLSGRKLVIEIQPDSTGSWINVGGESRTFSYTRSGDEIDVTVREDTAKDYLPGFPDISAEMSGITLDGDDTNAVVNLMQGEVGSIKWYPEGKTATHPMYSSTYTVTEDGQEYPYDDAVTWSVGMRLTSAITVGTYTV